MDYVIDFETNVRSFVGLFKTQDNLFYIVECSFKDCQFPQVIKDWSTIEKNTTSVKKIFVVTHCPICFDDVDSELEIVVLQCAHCFCADCHKKINSCPLCKSTDLTVFSAIPKTRSLRESKILLSTSDVLGYKVVGVVIQQNPHSLIKLRSNQSSSMGEQLNKGVMLNKVSALLSLQIESKNALVYKVQKGSGIVPLHKLKRHVKYCTNAIRTISARFIGDEKQIKQALLCYQTGNARFVSYHDKSTEYPLAKKVKVKTAGQGCGNSSCGQGLYFFIDVPSTLEFWSERNSCVSSENPSTPWMSDPILLSNGFQAIKLSDIHKQEIDIDNFLTNQNQLQSWCEKNKIKQLKERGLDLFQLC